METLAAYAPVAGLLFFFVFFVAVALWVMQPRLKQRMRDYAHIPLKEDNHGGQ